MTNYQISITVVGYDKASSPLKGVSGALGSLGSIAGGILTADLLRNIGRQLFDIGKQALDSYANFERLGMALQSLVARELLNTGKATDMAQAMGMASGTSKELLGWIEKLAIKSPFRQEDIANSFRLAMAYGFTTDEAKRMTKAMIDYAAGSGASSDMMNRIALALGQIKAKGKLAGQEVLQLTEAGLDVRSILAKAFGVTTEKLVEMQEKGLIPADKAIQAITNSLENDFGGAAAKQAGTFSGLLASLEDIKEIGLRTYFEGAFKAIQPYLNNFVEKFSDPRFMAGLVSAGQRLGDFVFIALDGFSKLQGDIQLLKARLEIFMQTPAFQKIFENFQNIFNVLTQPQVQEAGKKIFEGLKNFIQDLGEKVLPWAVSMFDKLSAWFVDNGPLIGAYVTTMAGFFTETLLPAITGMWQFIEPILSGLVDLLLGVVRMWMQITTGDWAGAWNTFLETVSNALIAIGEAILGFFNWIANLMGTSLQEIVTTWTANFYALKEINDKIFYMIGAAVRTKLTEVVTSIKTGVENMKNSISEQLENFFGLGQQVIEGFQSGVEDAFGNLYSTFIGLGYSMIEGFSDGVYDAFSSLLYTLEDLIDQLPQVIKDALGIASPSKVFMKLGRHMMEGLAVGITSAANLPQLALDKAVNGFTGGRVNNMKNYVDKSIDSSTKSFYYGPVYGSVSLNDNSLAGVLKSTRSR